MAHKIIPLAAALAALSGAATDVAAKPADTSNEITTKATESTSKLVPNVFYVSGEDLLGLVVTKQADGTILAQHSSHSSHRSHTSSRY